MRSARTQICIGRHEWRVRRLLRWDGFVGKRSFAVVQFSFLSGSCVGCTLRFDSFYGFGLTDKVNGFLQARYMFFFLARSAQPRLGLVAGQARAASLVDWFVFDVLENA